MIYFCIFITVMYNEIVNKLKEKKKKKGNNLMTVTVAPVA